MLATQRLHDPRPVGRDVAGTGGEHNVACRVAAAASGGHGFVSTSRPPGHQVVRDQLAGDARGWDPRGPGRCPGPALCPPGSGPQRTPRRTRGSGRTGAAGTGRAPCGRRPRSAGGRQRRADLGGMVGVVVKDPHSPGFALEFEAPGRAGEVAQGEPRQRRVPRPVRAATANAAAAFRALCRPGTCSARSNRPSAADTDNVAGTAVVELEVRVAGGAVQQHPGVARLAGCGPPGPARRRRRRRPSGRRRQAAVRRSCRRTRRRLPAVP